MPKSPLIVAAAIAYGVPGLALTFAPDDILPWIGASSAPPDLWLAQLLGAALLGLGYLNWLQRHAVVGGIYGRPLLLANLMFTTVGFFASARAWSGTTGRAVPAVTVALGLLMLAFGRGLFASPACVKTVTGD